MRHTVFEDIELESGLQKAWESLWYATEPKLLPSSWPWFSAWWRSFGHDAELGREVRLRVHCFEDSGNVVALFPMYTSVQKIRRLNVRALMSTSNGVSPYWNPIATADISADTLEAAVATIIASEAVNVVGMRGLPRESHLLAALRSPGTKCFRSVETGSLRTPIVNTNQRWSDFFESRSSKYRQNLRRKIRRFDSESALSVNYHELKSGDDESIDYAVQVSRNSWKSQIKNDLGSNVASLSFLRNLVSTLDAGDSAGIWFCWHNDTPIAFELTVRSHGVAYPLRADFDQRFRIWSPGSIAEYNSLKSAFDDAEVIRYDTCADDYQYLAPLADEYRITQDFDLFPKSALSTALWFAKAKAFPALRRLSN